MRIWKNCAQQFQLQPRRGGDVRLVSPSDVTTTLLPLRVDDLTFPIALDAALGSFSVRDQVTPAVGWLRKLIGNRVFF